MDTDVLVVGAGPTGLMLASQLARRGVRVSILDRHPGPALQSRALGVQARTLEIYAHLGIAERAVALGTRATGANMWARGRRAARVPFGDVGRALSPYPFLLILGQDDNEMLLGEVLRGLGVAIAWNTEVVGLTQEPDRVVARVKQPDGTVREVTAAWVAGCDGTRSAVREANGISFVGAPYEQVFFVADTRMTGSMVPSEVNVYLWPQGSTCSSRCEAPITGAWPASCPPPCGGETISPWTTSSPRSARRRDRSWPFRTATGSRPTGSITAAPSGSATGAASSWATPHIRTARSGRKA